MKKTGEDRESCKENPVRCRNGIRRVLDQRGGEYALGKIISLLRGGGTDFKKGRRTARMEKKKKRRCLNPAGDLFGRRKKESLELRLLYEEIDKKRGGKKKMNKKKGGSQSAASAKKKQQGGNRGNGLLSER